MLSMDYDDRDPRGSDDRIFISVTGARAGRYMRRTKGKTTSPHEI